MGYNTDILDDESISAYGKLVYFALSKYANKQGECWPSIKTVAKVTKISQNTVRHSVKELRENGWLVLCFRKTDSGNNDTNLYCLSKLYTTAPNEVPTALDEGGVLHTVNPGTAPGEDKLIHITNPIELSINNDEQKILDYLPTISQYPFDAKKDLEQVREWLKNYPVKHILDELEKFNAWWRDKESSFKKKKNFRSSITNWLKRSRQQVQTVKPKRKFLFDD